MNRTNNTRRAAVRSRVNDENAVPRANNAVRAAKPATRSGITQKEGNIKEVNGKTDVKRRKALEAVGHNEAPAPVQNGKVSQAQRQPLQNRSQAQNVYPSTRPIAPVPARTRPGLTTTTAVEGHGDFMVMDVDQGVVLGEEAYITDDDTVRGMSDDEEFDVEEEDWTLQSADEAALSQAEIYEVRRIFQDDIDEFDTTMVAEYADEIFHHMEVMGQSCRTRATWRSRPRRTGRCARP
jgi:G2/mitotic-specific cyclin 1/2